MLMKERIINALDTALISTLENMAFLDTSITDGPLMDHSNVFAVDYFTPYVGSLYFILNLDSKQQLVENILGDDWDNIDDINKDDCLLELLNVLAGSFMSNFLENNAKYKMSVPNILFSENEELQDCLIRTYDSEGYKLQLAIKLEGVQYEDTDS